MGEADSVWREREVHHDAFISYSRKDLDFVAVLERTLRRYKPPAGLNAPLRYLNIFLDTEDFTGTEYSQSVAQHLKASRKLIVVCSPNARRSKYVNDEIRIFAQAHGMSDVIPVLASGIPNNEAKSGDDPEMAFPAALAERLKIPLACDYRGFDPASNKWTSIKKYEQSWFQLLANIYDCSRDEIDQREQRRQRQQRIRWTSAAVTVGSILLVAGGIALFQRQKAATEHAVAEFERRTAESERLGAQSMQQADKDPNEALRLALAAVGSHETEQSVSALRLALAKAPERVIPVKTPARKDRNDYVDPPKFSFSPDARRIAIAERRPRIVDAATGEMLVRMDDEVANAADLGFSKNGAFVTVMEEAGATKVFNANSGKVVAKFPGELVWRTSTEGTQEAAVLRDASVEIGAFDAAGSWHTLRNIVPENYKSRKYALENDLSSSQAISPGGHKIASLQGGAKGSRLLVTDLDSGQKVSRTLSGPDQIIFSPKGSLLAVFSLNGGVFVLDAASLKTLFEHKNNNEMLDNVWFSDDDKLLAMNMREQAVSVWSIVKREQLATFPAEERVFDAVFSPDGDFMSVLYGRSNRVELFPIDQNPKDAQADAPTEAVAVLDPIWGGVRDVQFTPDGGALILEYERGVLAFWDIGRWRAQHRLPINFTPSLEDGKVLRDVKMTADGREIGVQSRTIWHGWRIETGERAPGDGRALKPVGEMTLREHGDYSLQVDETDARTVFLLRRSSGARQYPMSHSGPVLSMGFSANGNCVLTSSRFISASGSLPRANVARLWDTATGALLQEWRFPYPNPEGALFSGSDRVVALSEGAALVYETKLCANLDALMHQALRAYKGMAVQ